MPRASLIARWRRARRGSLPMLTFNAATARFLEETYLGSDFVRRRLANLEALAPQSGDRVIDVGCGPGFLTLELARAVGEDGQVIGVDPSPDMRAAAAHPLRRARHRADRRRHGGVASDRQHQRRSGGFGSGVRVCS